LKILIDTNVIVDIALQRQPFFCESDQVFKSIEQKHIEGYVSASTMSDLYYIIRKTQGRDWTLKFLQRLTTLCQIATVDRTAIEIALTSNFDDFEDAIQYSK
jgi:predicted nucleic acid-binding protein